MNLTIKLNEKDSKELQKIMSLYNEKTAAKAIKGMINQFLELREMASDSTLKLMQVDNENHKLRKLIEEKRAIENAINDII